MLLLTMAACGADDGGLETPPPETADTPSPAPVPETATDAVMPLAEMNSTEVARLMGHGVNLGNTMEACDSRNRIPGRDPSVYEQMWGQPITTQEMVSGMKKAGFDTLRIPVAWTNAMDFENGDHTIGKAYLDRVEEIINYALNEDMFVVVNDHWDHGWWSMFSHPEQAVRDKAMDIFVSMWTQIAERYSDYGHRLIFEAANEELGNRFNDRTPFNPQGGKLTQDECYELLTVVTQKFVDVVRAAGGLNQTRFLLIPGYNTDIVMTCDDRYEMPSDTADGKLLLSVHYYTPWSYCGDTASVGGWGTTGEIEEQNRLLEMMTKYTERGYGIVLGEWGVLDNDGPDRLNFFTNFMDNCDLYGYSSLLWDCDNLYSRDRFEIIDEDIAKLYKSRSAEARASVSVEEIIDLASVNIAWTLRKAANRPETVITADEAFAWIMFSSGDWSMTYSVGDVYKPESITAGMEAVDVEITGAGTYEVSLDFTGTDAGYADGIVFSAVGLINGEILFPGYFMELKEVLINGEPAEFAGRPYTTSDNGICTRVNLYNEWVSQIPDEARVPDGDLADASPIPLENYIGERIETIAVIFEYIEG
ncbi:MAG: glycoside hydrolase family 5 protein [Oscillospiraceae bacterium]|nr:glycoside hydrolase family 5 protein [Oscillospiraceae bacterium]